MLTQSQRLLLQCLADFSYQRVTDAAVSGMDWDELFGMAQAHSVEGIVYYQCRSHMPEEIKKKYLRQYIGSSVISIKREETAADLTARFERSRIQAVYMKGAVFRDYYHLAPLRSMGDVDIVVREKDREEVDRILRDEMDFRRFIDNQAVWTYWKEGQYIELHTRIFYDPLANKVDYSAYFDRIWESIHNAPVFGTESESIYVPDEDFHFLYLMAHTAKHIVHNGSGFRAYLDMVLMCRACRGKLDWEWITEELGKLKLLEFAKTCFALCGRWFGAEMPSLGGPESDPRFGREIAADEEFFDYVTEKTFEDGIFGLGNKANIRAAAAKDIKRSGNHYYAGAVKRIIKKLFPPYGDMQLVPWYSFLDGRPWLLPAAWVYRWFYCAVKKFKHSMALLAEPLIKKKEVTDREAYLEKWGL